VVGFVSDGAMVLWLVKRMMLQQNEKEKAREFEGSAVFFSFHCLLHQDELCAKTLKMGHLMDTGVKT
jgi:hypothetical protein